VFSSDEREQLAEVLINAGVEVKVKGFETRRRSWSRRCPSATGMRAASGSCPRASV